MSDASETPWNPNAGTRSYSDPTPPVSTEPSLLVPGQIVLGRYRLHEKLGEGGMGTVHKAQHLHLGTFFALKTLQFNRSFGDTRSLAARFQREMKAIASIEHPNVVRATDAGEENGLLFLVMEYVPGSDLERFTQRFGPLSLLRACELIRQAALGLSCIHACGWVHRDIKPSNLLLSEVGVLKIADLGLARDWSTESEKGPTQQGQWVGTPDYMAPEQATDGQTLDPRSDLYSLGCSLYRIVTGETPFPSTRYPRHSEKLIAHQVTPPPRLADTLQGRGRPVPSPLLDSVQAILDRLLAKNPSDRFAGAEQLAQALAALTRDGSLPSPHPLPVPPVSGSAVTAEELSRPPAPALAPSRSLSAPTSSRIRPFLALLIPVLLLVPLGLYLAGAFRPAEVPSPATPASPFTGGKLDDTASPTFLSTLPENQWHSLLQHSPIPLSWPVEDGISEWRWKSEQKLVNAGCSALGVLQLGRTEWPHYVYRVGFSQNRWKGGMGLFVGGRFPDVPGQDGYLQFLQFREEVARQGQRIVNITRGFGILSRRADGQWNLTSHNVTSSPLRELRGEITLEVSVSRHAIVEVRANGAPLTALCAPDVQPLFPVADPPGGCFGIYLVSSDATFRDAQFMRLPERP